MHLKQKDTSTSKQRHAGKDYCLTEIPGIS